MTATKLTDRFQNHADWDFVSDEMPIFMEHGMYMLSDGKTKHAVVKGKEPPEGSTLVYEVDMARLERIYKNIKRNYELDKPVKLYKDHSIYPSHELVGYHGPLTLTGDWNGIGAITAKKFVEKGCRSKLGKYKESSPEFLQPVDELPAVALLDTGREPRLPCGIMNYEGREVEVTYYDMAIQGLPTSDSQMPSPTGEPDGFDMDPTQIAICERIAKHFFQTMPQFIFLDQLFKDAQQPAQPPSPTAPGMVQAPPQGAGATPSSAPPPPQSQERYEMADQEKLHADVSEIASLIAGLEIYEFDRDTEIKTMGPMDSAGRKARAEQIKKFHKLKATPAKTPTGELIDTTGKEHYETPKAKPATVTEVEEVLYEMKWDEQRDLKWEAASRIATERKNQKK